jgi:hypothetical protein
LPDAHPQPVTIANLLTHTGGFDERLTGTGVRSPSELVPLGQYLADNMPPRVMPPGDTISSSPARRKRNRSDDRNASVATWLIALVPMAKSGLRGRPGSMGGIPPFKPLFLPAVKPPRVDKMGYKSIIAEVRGANLVCSPKREAQIDR